MDWKNAAAEVIEMASGCHLAAPRLVPADVFGKCDVLEGRAAGKLVKRGEMKAISEGRAFRLKLTGQRGRPPERIIQPPKPNPRKSNASPAAGAPRMTATGDKSQALLKASHAQELVDQIVSLQSQLAEAFEMIAKLKSKVRAVQADQASKSDLKELDCKIQAVNGAKAPRASLEELEETVKRQGTMIEILRQEWRIGQGYQPQHPELPLLSPRSLSVPTGARS